MNELSNACAVVGDMSVEVRPCRAEEFAQLISLLDEEFVFGKGRTLSLRQRFPAVYCHGNLHNLWVCLAGSEIISALVIRQFDWVAGNEKFRGAMFGGVYTHPAYRKKGWASRLLETATSHLRSSGIDFGVLWTGQPAFYARLGWVLSDNSVLGEWVKTELSAGVGVMPLVSNEQGRSLESAGQEVDFHQLENIRHRYLSQCVARIPENYCHLPLPAVNVNALITENQHGVAYALLGSAVDTAFLYELIGEQTCFPQLWSTICGRYERIMINDQPRSSFVNWINTFNQVVWQEKYLAMWLPLSERVNKSLFSQWQIPYFDRI